MPCIIRKAFGDHYENYLTLSEDEWALTPQIEALETWLRERAGDLDPSSEWVADIGFTPRADATGGGPIIGRALMRDCLNSNIEIWLSEYGD